MRRARLFNARLDSAPARQAEAALEHHEVKMHAEKKRRTDKEMAGNKKRTDASSSNTVDTGESMSRAQKQAMLKEQEEQLNVSRWFRVDQFKSKVKKENDQEQAIAVEASDVYDLYFENAGGAPLKSSLQESLSGGANELDLRHTFQPLECDEEGRVSKEVPLTPTPN